MFQVSQSCTAVCWTCHVFCCAVTADGCGCHAADAAAQQYFYLKRTPQVPSLSTPPIPLSNPHNNKTLLSALLLDACRQAAQQVQQHMRQYSPATALPPSQQVLLEVCAQASEEVLARGVLLGGATAWINNR
jgi:hypothetical protein